MSTHQLPIINNQESFEDLVCDLFNAIESTSTFKKFGKKGHNQKGIDIFSTEKDIVIQCKKKDLSRREMLIRKEILQDIENDIAKIVSSDIKLRFNRMFFVSTYKNHPDIDEFCEALKEEKKLNFEVIYWGWDTVEEKIFDYKILINKYFSEFVVHQPPLEVKLRTKLNLKKKIEKDFGLWLNFPVEKRSRNSGMILRAFDDQQYPFTNNPDQFGEYPWFKASIKSMYHDGLEFIYGMNTIYVYKDRTWSFEPKSGRGKHFTIKAAKVGQINFSDIVGYDINGDEYDICPHIFCKFIYKGLPFENTYFYDLDHTVYPNYYEFDKQV